MDNVYIKQTYMIVENITNNKTQALMWIKWKNTNSLIKLIICIHHLINNTVAGKINYWCQYQFR